MDKTKINLARLRAYDENPWDENKHPRADNGQFTSGSGSAGGNKFAQKTDKEKLKYFENLLPEAAKTSYDLGLVVRNLIVHMQAEGMTAEQAIATEDEVVKMGNIGGSISEQKWLKKKWSDFKAQYLSSGEDKKEMSEEEINRANLKYFKNLLPKAAKTSNDLALIVSNLIRHMDNEGKTAEQAIAEEDEVVKIGIGGTARQEESLRRNWSAFKAQYLSSGEDVNG